MKKVFLIITPFVFLSTLSAQITREEADEIVLERMSREIPPYTVYAETDGREGAIITTSAGEVIELDYACWVYYIRNAIPINESPTSGRYLIVNKNSENLLTIHTKDDFGANDMAAWRIVTEETLKGTVWKLVGVVDVETGNLRVFHKPEDCRIINSFTLMFNSDFAGIARSTGNQIFVDLSRKDYVFNGRTMATECSDDGWFFYYTAGPVTFFTLKKNELKFFYKQNEKEYYFLYHKI